MTDECAACEQDRAEFTPVMDELAYYTAIEDIEQALRSEGYQDAANEVASNLP